MKILRAFIFVLGLSLMFVACNGESSNDTDDHTTSDSTPIGTLDPPDSTTLSLDSSAILDSTSTENAELADSISVETKKEESNN